MNMLTTKCQNKRPFSVIGGCPNNGGAKNCDDIQYWRERCLNAESRHRAQIQELENALEMCSEEVNCRAYKEMGLLRTIHDLQDTISQNSEYRQVCILLLVFYSCIMCASPLFNDPTSVCRHSQTKFLISTR